MDKNFINDLRPRSKSVETASGDGAPRKRGGKKRIYLWGGLVVIAVILLGLLVSTMRATATVKVTPVQQVVTVDHIIAAFERGTDGAGIPFERISSTESDTIAVPATGVREVAEKAKGLIIIENKSDKVQRFVAKTRFQSKGGQIYRTMTPVTIPAAGKDGSAGTIEANIISDAAGEGSNMEAGSPLTVPGLAGGVLFEQVTAKTKTKISGGFVGSQKTASPTDIKSAEDKMKAELIARLAKKQESAILEEAVLYEDANFVTFASANSDSTDVNTYSEKLFATQTGFVFKKADLAQMIAERTTADMASSSVEALDLEKLAMRILGRSSIDPQADTRFSFSLQGSVKLVWRYDEAELGKALAGVARDRYQEVFRRFPTIERAEATFKPKWRRSFPSDPQKITIETVITP